MSSYFVLWRKERERMETAVALLMFRNSVVKNISFRNELIEEDQSS